MWITQTEKQKALSVFCGMKYHGGKTIEYWKEITGKDPAAIPEIRIYKSRHNEKLCFWTKEAERIYSAGSLAVQNNFALLGI